MKKIAFASLLIIFNSQLFAARVDTVAVYSTSMRKEIKCLVVLPDSYKKKSKSYPSLYILSGLGSTYRGLISTIPELKTYADQYQMIIITPDSGQDSWYFDSPVDPSVRFETYISSELPTYITKNYRTINDRSARGITGISMGGHGALFLAFRHQSVFGACGSISGALVIEQITIPGYGVVKALGDTANKKRYHAYSILGEMDHNHGDSLSIIIDCGTEDPGVIDMNRIVHEKMLALKIKHDYTERPGSHNTPYWANSLQYQLLFFDNFFSGKLPKNVHTSSLPANPGNAPQIRTDAIDTAQANLIAGKIALMFNKGELENIYNLFSDEKKQKSTLEQFKQLMQQAKSYIGELSAFTFINIENNVANYKAPTKNPGLSVYLSIDNNYRIKALGLRPG